MLPAGLTVKAIQLCAAGLATVGSPAASTYAITVRAGPNLTRQPATGADAEATIRDLIALGADFEAGPLAIAGRDFTAFGVTPATVFDACALARIDDRLQPVTTNGPATVSRVAALLKQAFGARVTDTIRPRSAHYGARYSWHKVGQAIDFVPAGGVDAIDRAQLRGVMDANGIRVIELLGPGDRGHANHWHLAFARPGQSIDQPSSTADEEDWIVDVANPTLPPAPDGAERHRESVAVARLAQTVPLSWDVFGQVEGRRRQGDGS